MFDILIRFRVHKVALTADIEKAFLSVSIKPEQRNMLRFLWIDSTELDDPCIVVYRFCRLVFGLISSLFVLGATVRHHMSKYVEVDLEFVLEVLRSLYVDDYESGADSVDSAFGLFEQLNKVFKEGGFNMRKWCSNDMKLMERTESVEKEQVAGENNSHQSNKVLGILWDNEADLLKFDLEEVLINLNTDVLTKRMILSTTAKFFDPLGLISPVILQSKILFQDICRAEINEWDQEVHGELKQRFMDVIEDIRHTKTILVNRCYFTTIDDMNDVESVQLHSFGDASNVAFGSNVYVKVQKKEETHVELVTSKTRVAPLKEETTPRLELLSALTTARLINTVKEALSPVLTINQVCCWLDSQVALYWTLGVDKEYKPFVQNRVREIRDLVDLEFWGYCNTKENPTDITSKGCKTSELVNNDLWWKGPQFLTESDEMWSNIVELTSETEEKAEKEMRKSARSVPTEATVNLVSDKKLCSVNEIIGCEHFSDLHKLFRITAYVKRFIVNLRSRICKSETALNGRLTVAEVEMAKTLWIKHVQQLIFQDAKFKQMQISLGVYKDDSGVLRCSGRIQNSLLPYSTKCPVLQPKKHYFTHFIILDCHEKVFHNKVNETLTQLRSEYWVVKGRQAVKEVVGRCVICKKLEGKCYSTPPAPPSSSFRVSEDLGFTSVGIDHAGPVFVKNINESDGTMYKAYITVFTCTSTRAIHLELSPNLLGNSLIRTLRRFKGRRGIPALVVSNNGQTFKDSKVKAFLLQERITWNFNVPRGSWWGGFFEIIVKLVKRCLRKTLQNARLTFEELETILVEIEAVLNSRPLTYSHDELSEPLTLSMLVTGKLLLNKNNDVLYDVTVADEDTNTLNRRARYLCKLLSYFRGRWRREYHTSLRKHHNCLLTKKLVRPVQCGDIVYVYDEKIKRQLWNIGRIKELLPGTDGQVRSAIVRTMDKSKKPVNVIRPVQKLIPLEVAVTESAMKEETVEEPQIKTVLDEEVHEMIKVNK